MNLHPVPGHPGYHVDEDGNVWSTRRLGRGPKPHDAEPRLMRTYVAEVMDESRRVPYRRRMVRLGRDGGLHKVARLVCLTFHGEPGDPTLQVAHVNGDSLDNRPLNLAWKTPSANQMDRAIHGTHNRDEQHGAHTLTNDQVEEIRSTYARGGVTQRSLASRYGVSQGHISVLVNRKQRAWTA